MVNWNLRIVGSETARLLSVASGPTGSDSDKSVNGLNRTKDNWSKTGLQSFLWR